jgi:hypothetical protein
LVATVLIRELGCCLINRSVDPQLQMVELRINRLATPFQPADRLHSRVKQVSFRYASHLPKGDKSMNELFFVRIFAYSILPLLLAAGHYLIDRQSRTPARRIELFILYVLAISVGANGLSGAFGHLFLSDVIAEGIGWPTGSPFQLEMAFANLLIGVLGLMAISRRDGFRTAAILSTAIIGFGSTAVHLWDIALAGNLSPGNTIQNVGNLLDPMLLIGLTWLASRTTDPDAESPAFLRWQIRQQPVVGMAAAGIGTGFGIGFAVGGLLLWTIFGALAGVGIGVYFSIRNTRLQASLAANNS